MRKMAPVMMYPDNNGTATLLTLKEVAVYLGVTERTVYRYLKKRDLPGLKVGGLWRFKDKAIEAWLQMHSGAAFSPAETRQPAVSYR